MPQRTNAIHSAVDRYIDDLARALVDKHGPEAPVRARRAAQRLEAAGDRQASIVWRWIHHAAESALRDPKSDHSVH